MKKNLRRILFTAGLLIIIVAICCVCFIVGRGHTVYFDNKTIEGTSYEAYNVIQVNYKGEKACELYKRERGVASVMGQKLTIEIISQKGKMSNKETQTVTIDLPYSMDNIVINLPAYLQGADYDTYLTKFVSLQQESVSDDAPAIDEFGLETME